MGMTLSIAPVALAIVRVPVAPLLAEPRISSGQSSQLLAGHPVDILEARDEWLRVCGEDGYDGWMHRGYLTVVDRESSWSASRAGADLLRDPRLSLACVTRQENGHVRRLPLGAWLDENEQVMDGETIHLGECEHVFPRDAAAICRTARRFFQGSSYLWGGVTPWGADCSGLVQTVYGLHGVALPRDAWQQSSWGVDAGTAIDALAVGDLLFFSDRPDREVTHVAISCGPRRIMHLAVGRGGWQEERLDDAADGYVTRLRERFLFARRML